MPVPPTPHRLHRPAAARRLPPRLPRRLPRAGIDPINTAELAGGLLDAVAADPPRHETIAVLLDDADRGICVLSVDGTTDQEAVLEVAELLIEASLRLGDVAAVILASVRPGGSDHVDDLERWTELSARFDDGGLELIEWFVIGRSTSCPRALLGAPPRWRS
ncbi:MAG: hypothetical protein ACE37B_04905 [Ilumatobacter sp.]|jgi:hypothetical protein|uniref:hypothetical protein n=1 Tax=Ilumatobacter sp. TaxID=1967498 RepID=UPI00391AB845